MPNNDTGISIGVESDGTQSRVSVRATLSVVSAHPLDDPVRNSLEGSLSRFAVSRGRIVRADPEVSPFLVHPDVLESQDWDDIAALFGPRTVVGLNGPERALPEGWSHVETFGLVQLVGTQQIEPVHRPIVGVFFTIQKTANQFGTFLRRSIVQKTPHFIGIRQQANRVQKYAAKKCRVVA